jgi:hypothetical protein
MSNFNFNETAKTASKEFGLGGNYLKLSEGDNKLRLLASAHKPTVKHFIGGKPVDCTGPQTCQHHKEKASVKYKTYVLDRTSGRIQPYDMPFSVFKAIGNLQQDEEYSFDSLPMPYDIKIKYDPNASPSDMYKTIPSPKRENVSAEVLEELSKLPDLNADEKKEDEIPVFDEEEKVTEEDLPF